MAGLLPWRERIQTAPTLPGSVDLWPQHLATVLNALASSERDDTSVFIPGVAAPLTPSEVVKCLGPSLVERVGHDLRPTAEAKQWLESREPAELILLIHRRVRFIVEILDLLRHGELTHEELRARANERYAMGWNTLDQIRRRTTWLRTTGMAELYDGKIHLTDAGRELLATTHIGKPDPLESDDSIQVAELSPVVTALLSQLARTGHQSRKLAKSLYLPSPEGSTSVEEILAQVIAATPSALEQDLDELLQRRANLAEASARQARGSIKSLGLISLAGPKRWSSTESAKTWLESGNPADLVAISHVHIWYIGEVLEHLSAGPATAVELAKQSSNYGRPALDTAEVRTRLAILRECGTVEKLSHQLYRLTALGRGVLALLPIEAQISAEEATPVSSATESTASTALASFSIADELRDASRDSRHPERMERAVADAFSYLGLDVEHVAGAGKTDVVAVLSLPGERTVLAIEVKTTADGQILDSHVSFEGLREHRAKCGAEISILVGPAFHPRVHAAAQTDGRVAVLSSETLATAVLLHATSPFSPKEIGLLVAPELSSDQRKDALTVPSGRRDQLGRILQAIINQLDLEIRDDSPMYPGGWLGVNELRRDLRKLNASAQVISDALDILSSPFVDVLEREKDRWRLAVPPALVSLRLHALADRLGAQGNGGEVDAEQPPSMEG